jgi:hypothetical protein
MLDTRFSESDPNRTFLSRCIGYLILASHPVLTLSRRCRVPTIDCKQRGPVRRVGKFA